MRATWLRDGPKLRLDKLGKETAALHQFVIRHGRDDTPV